MRAAALLLLFGTLCAGQSFDYRKAARDAVNNLDVQQSLPNDSTVADEAKEHPQGVEYSTESGSEAPGLAAVWGQLKWVVLGLLAVAILGFVASQFTERRDFARPASAAPSTVVQERAPPSMEQLLAEADACAGEGRYRDAMHYVLLAAMARVGARLRDGAPDSATSWELLRATELRPSERMALRDLLTRTDRTWFGEYVSGVEEYEGARHCFHEFLTAGEAA